MNIFEFQMILKNELIEFLKQSDLKNLKGVKLNIIDRFFENFDHESCPILTIQMAAFSEPRGETEQFFFRKPFTMSFLLILIDYSMKGWEDADYIVWDLFAKIIKKIEEFFEIRTDITEKLREATLSNVIPGVSEVEENRFFSSLRGNLDIAVKLEALD
ncbi:MAG: hypothetical protein NZ891_04415 [bacterium]|nr:hypothetical protein [bacterium]MDW8163967.1 hypothetical protein [Candidatus Omnitrophota bacterium]